MHLLHSTSVPNPQFAALSLIIATPTQASTSLRRSTTKSDSNSPDSNSLIMTRGETIVLPSPTSTTLYPTAMDALDALHQQLETSFNNNRIGNHCNNKSNHNHNEGVQIFRCPYTGLALFYLCIISSKPSLFIQALSHILNFRGGHGNDRSNAISIGDSHDGGGISPNFLTCSVRGMVITVAISGCTSALGGVGGGGSSLACDTTIRLRESILLLRKLVLGGIGEDTAASGSGGGGGYFSVPNAAMAMGGKKFKRKKNLNQQQRGTTGDLGSVISSINTDVPETNKWIRVMLASLLCDQSVLAVADVGVGNERLTPSGQLQQNQHQNQYRGVIFTCGREVVSSNSPITTVGGGSGRRTPRNTLASVMTSYTSSSTATSASSLSLIGCSPFAPDTMTALASVRASNSSSSYGSSFPGDYVRIWNEKMELLGLCENDLMLMPGNKTNNGCVGADISSPKDSIRSISSNDGGGGGGRIQSRYTHHRRWSNNSSSQSSINSNGVDEWQPPLTAEFDFKSSSLSKIRSIGQLSSQEALRTDSNSTSPLWTSSALHSTENGTDNTSRVFAATSSVADNKAPVMFPKPKNANSGFSSNDTVGSGSGKGGGAALQRLIQRKESVQSMERSTSGGGGTAGQRVRIAKVPSATPPLETIPGSPDSPLPKTSRTSTGAKQQLTLSPRGSSANSNWGSASKDIPEWMTAKLGDAKITNERASLASTSSSGHSSHMERAPSLPQNGSARKGRNDGWDKNNIEESERVLSTEWTASFDNSEVVPSVQSGLSRFSTADASSWSSPIHSTTTASIDTSNTDGVFGLGTKGAADVTQATTPLDGFKEKRQMSIGVALNEDLRCTYQNSILVSNSVDGLVQIRTDSTKSMQMSSTIIPFRLMIRDPGRNIRTIQESRACVDDVTSIDEHHEPSADRTYIISLPSHDRYYPVVKYKCTNDICPVPLRVQSRLRMGGNKACRIVLQITSNPVNRGKLMDLTISVAIPQHFSGSSVVTVPPGGVWEEEKQCVSWCVAELGSGEKFQLQAQMAIAVPIKAGKESTLKFPVSVRCHRMYAQLSQVHISVAECYSDPAEIKMKFARRFRVHHRET